MGARGGGEGSATGCGGRVWCCYGVSVGVVVLIQALHQTNADTATATATSTCSVVVTALTSVTVIHNTSYGGGATRNSTDTMTGTVKSRTMSMVLLTFGTTAGAGCVVLVLLCPVLMTLPSSVCTSLLVLVLCWFNAHGAAKDSLRTHSFKGCDDALKGPEQPCAAW